MSILGPDNKLASLRVDAEGRLLTAGTGGGGGGGGITDLSVTAGPTTVTIASSTGTDALLEAAGANAGLMLPAQVSKLAGVAAGATVNSADSALRDRSTHTGEQAQGTVTGLVAALAGKQATLVSGATIKTINGASLLGSGDLVVSGGGGGSAVTVALQRDYNRTDTRAPLSTNNVRLGRFVVTQAQLTAAGGIQFIVALNSGGTVDGLVAQMRVGAAGTAYSAMTQILAALSPANASSNSVVRVTAGISADSPTELICYYTAVGADTGNSVPDTATGRVVVNLAALGGAALEFAVGANTGATDRPWIDYGFGWFPGNPVGSLATLSDVNLSGLVVGQTLVWDGTAFVVWGSVATDATTRAAVAADFQRPYLNWGAAASITLNRISGLPLGAALHIRHGGAAPSVLQGTNVSIANSPPSLSLRGRTTLQLIGDDGTTQTFEYV